MFLQKEYPNILLKDFKTVNDQRLSIGQNLLGYYFVTFNHKEKILKRGCQKIAKRPVVWK